MSSFFNKPLAFALFALQVFGGCHSRASKSAEEQANTLKNFGYLGYISSPLDKDGNFAWGIDHTPNLGLLDNKPNGGVFFCDHLDLSRGRPKFETVNQSLQCFQSLESLKKPKNHMSSKGAQIACQRKSVTEEVKCKFTKEVTMPDSPSDSPGSTQLIIQSLESDGTYFTGNFTALAMAATSGKALYCPKAKESDQITCYFSRAEMISHLTAPIESFEKSAASEDGSNTGEYLVGTISFCEGTKPAKCKFYAPIRATSK